MARKTKTDPEARRAEVAALHETLNAQIDGLLTSAGWAAMLAGAAHMRGYSVRNLLLILAQRPDARAVRGYQAWKKAGRQVRKGEKSIRILAPMTFTSEEEKTDPATGQTETETKQRVRFKATGVFDIAQTDPIEGEDHGALSVPAPLADETDPDTFAQVAAVVEQIGWTLAREDLGHRPGLYGYATTDGSRRIVLAEGQSGADALATLIHEIAHVVCGHVDKPAEYRAHRGRAEVEAESIAHIVAAALGLDTTRYSVAYVANWAGGKDAEEARANVSASAAAVLKASDLILTALEPEEDEDDGEPTEQPTAEVA